MKNISRSEYIDNFYNQENKIIQSISHTQDSMVRFDFCSDTEQYIVIDGAWTIISDSAKEFTSEKELHGEKYYEYVSDAVKYLKRNSTYFKNFDFSEDLHECTARLDNNTSIHIVTNEFGLLTLRKDDDFIFLEFEKDSLQPKKG